MDEDTESGFLRSLLPRQPKDAICLGLAATACGFIAVNALFLQSGPHPAPIFIDPPQQSTASATDVPLPPAKRQTSARLPAATLSAVPPTPVKTNGTLPAAAPVRTTATIPVPPAPVPVKTSASRTESRPDPIAELLEPTNRTVAVQRVLTEFGYGQIKPTGTVGPDTKAAIEKFERERKMPVTGQLSDRLVRELSAMSGRAL